MGRVHETVQKNDWSLQALPVSVGPSLPWVHGQWTRVSATVAENLASSTAVVHDYTIQYFVQAVILDTKC